jgi:V-type H+-transporting ATPase subunit H
VLARNPVTTSTNSNANRSINFDQNKPNNMVYDSPVGGMRSEVLEQESSDGQKMTEAILKRQVPWDTYQKADLISDRELQLIKRYDKQDRERQQRLLLEEEGVLYLNAFFSLLRSIASEEVVQYVLALLEEMILAGGVKVVSLLKRATTTTATSVDSSASSSGSVASSPSASDTCAILLRMLQRPDWFTQEKAAFVLASVLSFHGGASPQGTAGDSTTSQHTLHTFVEWLCSELKRGNATNTNSTITCLSLLLRERDTREIFLKHNGLSTLCPHLVVTPTKTQTLYETCLCLWLLSFCKPAVEEMVHLNMPIKLVEIIRQGNKEKVLRVATMCLREILQSTKENRGMERYSKLLSKLIENGLSKHVAIQKMNSHTDEELLESLDWLEEKLLAGVIKEISSFDKYADEVLSGTLDWTLLHKQDKFWKANASHFVAKDCTILKALVQILEHSTDERSLEVACHDLGKFINHYPHARGFLKGLKVKPLVMKLMVHPDPDVQKQALMCTQKLMLSKDSLELLSFG